MVTMNHQFAELSLFQLTGDINRPDDEPISKTVVPDDPVAAFVEEAALASALRKDEPDFELAGKILAEKSTPEAKPAQSRFAKGTLGYKLGIVRTEEKVDEDGAKWIYGYDAAGELVDAHVIEG
jgi:hypothetical protein